MINLKGLFLLGIFLLGCTSFAVDFPSEADTECKSFVKSIELTHNYGWLQVPEIPGSATIISVFYYFNKKASLNNPVIFFNGGPGSSSHRIFSSLEKTKDEYDQLNKKDLDFIFMDQRGVGCSSHFPMGMNSEIIEKLKWYGSAGIVNDAEKLRQYLIGDKKWKVFGQSYGGLVVHRYIELFPESILGAFAHGFAIGQSDFDASYARISSKIKVLESYYLQYPDDQNRLAILNNYLSDKTKCFNKDNYSLCGFEILYPFIERIGFRFGWNELHYELVNLVSSNKIDEIKLKDFVARINSQASYHNNVKIQDSYFLQHSAAISFIGLYDSNNLTYDFDKCLAVYKKIEKELQILVGDTLLDECKAPFQFHFKEQITPLLLKRIDIVDSNFVQLSQVKKNLINYNIPFFLYSGELDGFIPTALFKKEVEELGSSVHYTNFLNSGHEGFMTEPRVLKDLTN